MTASVVSPKRSKTSPSHLIDDYILKRIDFQARRLAIRFALSDDRRDDMHQDMVIELLKAADRFNPNGTATWHTYACRVLDLAVKKLVQGECRLRQREAGKAIKQCNSGKDDSSAINNPIDEGEDDLFQLELRMDIDVVLKRMPSRLQKVCRLLMRMSPSEAAEAMGIHRNSIYRLIAQARAYFLKCGLEF